jgi:hypothetical protein
MALKNSVPSRHIILLFIEIMSANASAQFLDQNQYSKIIIPKNRAYTVLVDSIYIDTLVMEDYSKLAFNMSTVLIIENASIGDWCVWDASGENASGHGEDGLPGKSISTVMVIQSLGSLTINTQGGSGSHGATGRLGSGGAHGAQYADGGTGGNGGDGGNGGNAGDIKFHYSSRKVISAFGDQPDYTVILNNKGGNRGEGGSGGKGGAGGRPRGETDPQTGKTISVGNHGKPGLPGHKGNPGTNGTEGRLIFKRFD